MLQWGLLALIAILVLTLFGADYLLTRNRDQLAGWLSELIGRPVLVEGEIRFRYTPYPTLIVEDIRIRNPSWASRPDVISARRLSLSIALLPLLERTVEFHDASLQGADLLLERNTGGEGNWVLPALAGKPGSSETPETRDTGGGWRFAGLQHLGLSQARIGYRPVGEDAYQIELEQAGMALYAGTPLELHSRGRYRDRPFSLQARGGTFEALLDNMGPAFPLEVTFRLGEDELNLSARFAKPLGSRLTLQGQLAGPNLAGPGVLMDVELPASGPYTLAAGVVIEPDEIRVDQISGQLSQLGKISEIVIRDGNLKLSREEPLVAGLEGEIDSRGVSLQLRGGSIRQLRQAGKRWPVALQARVGDLGLDAAGNLDLTGEEFLLDTGVTVKADTLTGLGSWLPLSVQRLAPFAVQGQIKVQPTKVQLERFSARSGKSDLAGNLTLMFQHDLPRLQGKLDAKQIDVTPLFRAPGDTPPPDGRTQSTVGPLQQRLDFTLPTGFELDLELAVGKFRGVEYPLRNLRGKVGLRQGSLELTPLRFEVPGAAVTLTASMSTTEKGLQLAANATSKRVALYTLLSGAGITTPVSGLVRDAGFELSGHGMTVEELLRQATLRLSTGQVVLIVNKADKRHQHKIHLQRLVASSRPGQAIRIQTECLVEGMACRASLEGGTLATLLKNEGSLPVSLRVDLPDANLAISGEMALPPGSRRFDFSYRLSGKNMHEIGRVLKTELPLQGQYDLSGKIRLRDRKLELPTFTAQIEKTRIEGQLSIKQEAKRVFVDGHARVNRLSLDMLVNKQGQRESLSVSEEKKEPEEVILPIDLLKNMTLGFGIEVDRITRSENDLGSFRMQATVRDGVVSVTPARLSLNDGGQITGMFRFDSTASPPSMLVESSGTPVNYGSLLRKLEISDVAEGELDFSLKLVGQGATLLTLLQDTRGHLAILGGEGRFRNRDLKVTLNLNNVIHTMMPSFFRKEEDIRLKCFVTRWKFHDGKAVTDETLLQTNKVNIAMTGYVDVIERQLDLLISPRAIDRTVIDVAVPVRVRGSLSRPAIIPGALPSLSVLGLVNLNLNYPTDLLGMIKPVDEMLGDVPPDTNRCVATIAYLKSQAERKGRRPVRSLLEDIGKFLSGE